MSDSIVYRKDVYNALVEKGQASRRYKLGEEWELNGKEIREALENVPSAEPEIIRCSECKYSQHWYGDKSRCFLWHPDGIDVFNDGFCNYGRRGCDMAVTLEVIQPKIIHCRDCKYYDGRPCGIVDWYNTDSDFCSRAERRTDE